MAPSFDLSGSVALVTGGGAGIGRRIGLALAQAGAAVVLAARRRALLDEAAAEITDAGGKASALAADLSEIDTLDAVAEAAAQPFGPPDIVVNAAGVNLREPWEAITPDSWSRTIAINLTAPFFLSRALAPAMMKKGHGKIINLASLQSVRAFPDSMAYGASKGGVAQLTRAMAEAWSPSGITCNALVPGFFPTELTEPVFGDPARAAEMAARTAIGRNGEMEDLDGIAVFLAAPASDYITGQVIFLDGGLTAK